LIKDLLRNFTEEVYLSQIYPATNSGKWGKNAIEFLKKLFDEVNMIVDLEQDGNVYLRPKSNDAILERINSDIYSAFHNSKPNPEEDLFWSKWQAASVKWHFDNRWYRAFVLQVRPNVCRVKLIDYGTEELCLFENMRKRLMFKDIPTQCFPLKLSNCCPADGDWDEESLTFLHELVVDQELIVQINEVENIDEKEGCFNYVGDMKICGDDRSIRDILVSENIVKEKNEEQESIDHKNCM